MLSSNNKSIFSWITAFCMLTNIGMAYAIETPLTDSKFPSQFAIPQQQGLTCFYIPFSNLKLIKENRENNEGKINLEGFRYFTKIDSYAWFFPQIRALDRSYDFLRSANGAYAIYERELRSQGIKNIHRYSQNGKHIKDFDWLPTTVARRLHYTPYNIKVEENPFNGMRWVPILHSKDNGHLYFYDFLSKKTTQLDIADEDASASTDFCLAKYVDKQPIIQWCRINDEVLVKMGIMKEELKACRFVPVATPFLGSETAYYVKKYNEDIYNMEDFYEVGAYQHMLFACGLDRDNKPFTGQSPQWAAHQEFKGIMDSNPSNPWAGINKNDLFEYHLTNIFQSNEDLKNLAMQSVNFYNKSWEFYKESFDFYDSKETTKIKFSHKQNFLPGEDQMLAYFFSSELRFTWVASLGIDAACEIQELNQEFGETTVNALKFFSFMPGVPSVSKILCEADAQNYGHPKKSFLDVWEMIKAQFLETVGPKKDFVTFSGHGCVISFDPDLITKQCHEDKTVAQRLGFEMWETLYEKGINPFYQKPGTQESLVKFS